ncbi:MAG: hypothetical protein IKU73_01100 [Clostridia bacterium]|nr:hypothetical protein [Clostridia bacterium]
MQHRLTLELPEDTYEELLALSHAVGFSPEMTAEYAIRLVSACVREGLIEDVPARAWPKEAQLLTGTGGKVIDFPPAKTALRGE